MKQRTCETCRDRDKSIKKEPCLTCCTVFPDGKTFHQWRSRIPWKRIGWIAVIVVSVLGLLFCALSAAEDQRRIDSTPDAKARVESFAFTRPACAKIAVTSDTWKVYEANTAYTVTWTIFDNVAGDDGCAIGVSE